MLQFPLLGVPPAVRAPRYHGWWRRLYVDRSTLRDERAVLLGRLRRGPLRSALPVGRRALPGRNRLLLWGLHGRRRLPVASGLGWTATSPGWWKARRALTEVGDPSEALEARGRGTPPPKRWERSTKRR